MPGPGIAPRNTGTRLGGFRRQLGQKLGRRHPDRTRQPELPTDAGADGGGDFRSGPKHPLRAGHVEKGLVQRDAFHQRREVHEHGMDALAHLGIAMEPAGDEHGVRAQLPGPQRWHRRAHAVRPGLVAARCHDAPAARPADDHRLAGQLRAIEDLHRGVERVHVDVKDRPGRLLRRHAPILPEPRQSARAKTVCQSRQSGQSQQSARAGQPAGAISNAPRPRVVEATGVSSAGPTGRPRRNALPLHDRHLRLAGEPRPAATRRSLRPGWHGMRWPRP